MQSGIMHATHIILKEIGFVQTGCTTFQEFFYILLFKFGLLFSKEVLKQAYFIIILRFFFFRITTVLQHSELLVMHIP